MKSVFTFLLYLPLVVLIIFVGLYPFSFFILEGKVGILKMKDDVLLDSFVWKTFFYTHITFGGIALLTGWIQFNAFLRKRYLQFHRTVGKIYIICCWLSTLGVGYIGFFAEGGAIAFSGFMTGAFFWCYTTVKSYTAIRKGNVFLHRKFMIYSYAVCLGAVTLRIWLPLLINFNHDFILSYQLVSWISWVPNLIVAVFIAKTIRSPERGYPI